MGRCEPLSEIELNEARELSEIYPFTFEEIKRLYIEFGSIKKVKEWITKNGGANGF